MKSSFKRKNINQVVTQVIEKKQRDLKGQVICQNALNFILDKSYQILERNQKFNQLMKQQTLNQTQKFTRNNCGQVLQNFFIKSSDLSQQIKQQQSLVSPSKPKYSFLHYDEYECQSTRRSDLQVKRQPWQTRRNSRNIHNCNKLYIIKKSQHKKQFFDQNSTIKSLKFNETCSGFNTTGRFSHRPELKKISINQSLMQRNQVGRLTVDPFNLAQSQIISQPVQFSLSSPSNNFNFPSNSNNRSSFYQQISQKRQASFHQGLIKLQQPVQTPHPRNFEENEKQTNNYISFLRQRKIKLDTIMKSFDLDQLVKKNHKIQRQLMIRENKAQNLGQIYGKASNVTTDYEGNLMYVNNQTNINNGQIAKSLKQDKSKKKLYYSRYQANNQGSLAENVSFKIKDIDDKTKNFINQIFSSARGTPSRSNKKLMFNTKNIEFNNFHRNSNEKKTLKDFKNKYSLNKTTTSLMQSQNNNTISEYVCNSTMQPSIQPSIKGFNQESTFRKIKRSQKQKNLKSVLKLSTKYHKNNIQEQEQSEENKQNNYLYRQNQYININGNDLKKSQSYIKKNNKLKSQSTCRNEKNKKSENSLIQLERLYRQSYTIKKQRIHPTINSKKNIKLNTQSTEIQQIQQASNQNSQRNAFNDEVKTLQMKQSNSSNLKTFFDILSRSINLS